jgi:UDP-N-acetylglucosamine/UDP-N-acetylgalactosamine 4-epimerase
MNTSQTDRLKGALVLVTGGAGFIGSHLVDDLLSRGAKVRVLDNLETGHIENLAHVHDRIEFIQADIRQLQACQDACRSVDFVFHEAALGSVPRSLELPAATILSNVSGTANIFTAARDQAVKRVVYASSSSVYGSSERLPKREGEEGLPLSPYALSKHMDEELAEMFVRCYAMQIVGLRYFNVYGARQDPNGAYAAVIPKFFTSCRQGEAPIIYGDGEQSRDFTYVGDVVQANLTALLSSGGEGRAFNVGAGTRTTVNDLARAIAKATGFHGEAMHQAARSGDILHSIADTSRIHETFGWSASTTLDEGIHRCSIFYK